MKKKKVFLAHNNLDIIHGLSQILDQTGLYYLGGYATNGKELLEQGSLDGYDIILIKDALTYITGVYGVEVLLRNTYKKPDIMLIMTPFLSDFIVDKCFHLGLMCLNDMDIDLLNVPTLFFKMEMEQEAKDKLYFDQQMEVIDLLKRIGLMKHYIGYKYFEYILNAMFERSETIYKSMHAIYDHIARHFNTTLGSVEKSMRLCIKSSLKEENYYARLLFGYSAHNHPSISIFLQVSIKTLKEEKNRMINHSLKKQVRKI